MSAPARLAALRLQGFKSFAERTLVEFGPGISAVVGPNGSGKSNLADALRWALGEQGRTLRIRRNEDVIWAGSERRNAVGMADVTIVLDNGDGLLPVEFGTVEVGRRLYRSGENDYLLNRQRVRLRDLADLLEAANLADNAFLFIGQGMVDQALALRPEERRPLFEEVAGVRRHERRRRRAEEQLAEAEANLARVEDIVAELRPQARRLGQLAEQQASRATAGDELAAALVEAAHARWHEAAGRSGTTARRREGLRRDADAAHEVLEAAEAAVAALAASLAARGERERVLRALHDRHRAEVTALGLREVRASSELAAMARDRARIAGEIAAADAELAVQRRALAEAIPERDAAADAALADAERALAEALAELGTLRAASRARGEELAAVRRAAAARAAEAEAARRLATETTRRAADEAARAAVAEARRAELEIAITAARGSLAVAADREREAAARREAARVAADAAEGTARVAGERGAATGAALAGARARLEQIERRIAEEEERGIARAARRLGGRRVDEELGIDPGLRAAVEAALGELARAYVVDRAAAPGLAGERGHLLVRERLADGARIPGGGTPVELRRLDDAVVAAGGGRLADALRRDPAGAVRPLLGRVVWLPDLASALGVQGVLPHGWVAVVRDGSAVVDPLGVRVGRPDAALERRAEVERLRREVTKLAEELAVVDGEGRSAGDAAAAARTELERARADESAAGAARRRAEEAERSAARELEGAAREASWHAAQAERLAGEAGRAAEALARFDEPAARDDAVLDGEATDEAAGAPGDALATWEARAGELRARRDRLAAVAAEAETLRRSAEARRARAEAALVLAEGRIASAEREAVLLAAREAAAAAERETVTVELAAATAREGAALAELEALRADDRTERGALATAEAEAGAARERLRVADDRLRGADATALEARLVLDALREQLLVELAGLGDIGLRRLAGAAGLDPALLVGAGTDDRAADADADGAAERSVPRADDGVAPEAAALEAALDALAPRWAAERPPAEAPSLGRLAALRRRVSELGAANPYAVAEFEALAARLASLETQEQDLRDAITRTRRLIGDLDALIATQFRTTFAALETAFDARFRQLFGGGFARLVLTDPSDLAATGVEITAQPPGKRPQALAMLSGGERALTAVALLFAMLEVRPAPFCVLDEVDAALDEANVGRFTDALRALSERTQFVVITHNRGTIEAADALYGVTVGDDSVSRVLSLRLEEATALAEPARPAARGDGR